jgi:glycosyltransferase involved in cell wall biosynthesis
VLLIGDVGNYFQTVSKFVKKSKIHIINFPKDGAGIYTYDENYELFENYKVRDQVKKINEIKKNFDLALVMGTGERIAYLADLNYISYYVGRDIDAPRFIKNSKESWFKEPLHKLNFLERRFYKKTFDFAIIHAAPTWVFEHLKKYSKKCLKMDRKPIDLTLFENKSTPLSKRKEKFTFFCPQRMGIPKGTDILWKALRYCKTDFQILQVDWRDTGTDEENRTSLQLRENLPPQVKLIPMIKRKDMPSYYYWADAVIGNLRIGSFEYVELEGVICGKPVVSFTDKSFKMILEGTELQSPFLPEDNDPKIIAEVIDNIVSSADFREKLYKKEYEFVKEITDPNKAAEWWDSLFEKSVKKYDLINRKSSIITVRFRMLLFLIANRLYYKKLKRLNQSL